MKKQIPIEIKIRMLRKKIRTEDQLAEMCGASQEFISLLLRGHRHSDRVLGRVSEILCIPRERLLRLILQ